MISRGPETKIFPLLRELGIAVTAYGVLSRGLLAGSKPVGPRDFRAHLPRFAASENQRVVETLGQLAARRGVTPAQLAIAWSRARFDFVVPVMGGRTRKQLTEALAALELRLDPQELATIEAALPDAVGTRYAAPQMAHLDSER